eukprot:CAMPEP_0113480238 /NCGR_PEP_ID=MMETSP0014_2-20120614/21768_1 /TAXON_ID=2857 /ORGANISM="Nitzschia sp." /LENGTH=1302 /DNA_ID=CAMNT_0000373653 /DNA_START=126 /DNA_END=4034 /DNA_ORIENTATION=+ /assembly_acc=CAM_ASM_000159
MNVIPTTAVGGGSSAGGGGPTGAGGGGKGGSASISGNVAHVNFRVRCEGLGYGEEVFLVQDGDDKMQKPIPLYTTATTQPWYNTIHPVSLSLKPLIQQELSGGDGSSKDSSFRYRYAIHRGGRFYRMEQPSDAPQISLSASDDGEGDDNNNNKIGGGGGDSGSGPDAGIHVVPLRLLSNRESYVVNDVLGKTTGPPDIDHIRVADQRYNALIKKSTSASNLHSRNPSFAGGSGPAGASSDSALESSAASAAVTGSPAPASTARKKAVGFAPVPPPFHRPKTTPSVQQVHLNSTDGLVVVSAFLPVVLHRSDAGTWTADWDYEALLSMQTHLRVTRIGVVKWRGWHGNIGASAVNARASANKEKAAPATSANKDSMPPLSSESGVPVNERHLVEECLRPFNCVPVWIDPVVFGEMYNGFCKGILWPVLHNVTSVYSSQPDFVDTKTEGTRHVHGEESQFSEYCMDDVEQGPIHGGRGREKELWSAYNTVNRKFCEVVVQYFNEGDLVWVHGFHLLILPSYLTRRIPMAKVGIFLHTPFPSSEIFRTLWCREDLLRGMLNADQVGFHLFEYARHFLTCCRRLLGLNYGMIPDASGGHTLAIDTNGRHVAVTSIHAGVEPPVLAQILNHESNMMEAAEIRKRFPGKTIFCAIDRLESLKGIPLKLLGLERFLKRSPEWVGKIVLFQVGISAFERGDDYVKTRNEVTEMVHRINEIWPGTVQFQEQPESRMKLPQRLALMRAADVILVTPLRDGLNLLPLEFTCAHQDVLTDAGANDGRKRGLVILSEFASCTRVVRGALHVNPWKISEIADAFRQTLIMTDDERMRRVSSAIEFVTRVTTQRWALAVMLDLKGVHKSVNPVQYSGAGLGLGYRLLGMDVGFTSLAFNAVAKAFKSSRNRLILFDYGGTITSNENIDALARFRMVKTRKAHSEPTDAMIDSIRELCRDKKNTVFVVSGKERHSLIKSLGHIPRLGLAAEHGMFISWPTPKLTEKRQWETLVPITDRTWRSLAMAIMEVYTGRTHGSYIEETEMKVLWQYRDADLEFGYLQARELEDHLSNVLRSYPVDILHGGMEEGGYVEVRPKGVNKGVLAMKVIRNFDRLAAIGTDNKVDFSLVLGDDHCDEPMLSVMRQIGRRVSDARRTKRGEDVLPELPMTMTLVDVSACDDFLAPNLEVFTCTVGKKPSAAANYLHDVDEVQELLDALNKVSTRDEKYYSSIDLTAYAQEQGIVIKRAESPSNSAGSTMSTGMGQKSMSVDQLSAAGNPAGLNPPADVNVSVQQPTSTNLAEFLGEIGDDDDDDEGNFF